jgi:hypothetical protein
MECQHPHVHCLIALREDAQPAELEFLKGLAHCKPATTASAVGWIGYAVKSAPGAFIAAWTAALQRPEVFMAARDQLIDFHSFRSAGCLRVRLSGPRLELDKATE